MGGAGAVPGGEEKKEVFDEAREDEDAKKRKSIRELREQRPKRRFPRISFAEQVNQRCSSGIGGKVVVE